MVLIQPFQPSNVNPTVATKLTVRSVFDDLKSQATFYYQLLSDDDKEVYSGNVNMQGLDYSKWNGSNTDAYAFVASAIKVTIKK
jgi:hypothetical protein